MSADTPRCGYQPYATYAPCTRDKGHSGLCAHPLAADTPNAKGISAEYIGKNSTTASWYPPAPAGVEQTTAPNFEKLLEAFFDAYSDNATPLEFVATRKALRDFVAALESRISTLTQERDDARRREHAADASLGRAEQTFARLTAENEALRKVADAAKVLVDDAEEMADEDFGNLVVSGELFDNLRITLAALTTKE